MWDTIVMNFSVPFVLLASIVVAAVLIYFPYGVVVYGRMKVGMDIAAPRALFDKLPDIAKRGAWAHQNSFETFTPYVAAALMAYVTGVTDAAAANAAIAFVVSRFFFSLFYILNIAPLRSLMFGVGSAATGTLFYLSLMAAR
jgi:uncharacterized MAPEG superfamily protein